MNNGDNNVHAQSAGKIDLDRMCEVIDETKIKWIDARSRAESGRKEDNMAKFKVGDRVELISKIHFTHACIGDKGKVVSAIYNIVGDTYLTEFALIVFTEQDVRYRTRDIAKSPLAHTLSRGI